MEFHSIYSPTVGYQEVILYETNGSHSNGTIGPLFVVLAIIIILGVFAGFVGRVCGGRQWSGDTEYDFEGWVERRCANCIDGDLETGRGGGGGGGGDGGEADAKPVANGTVAAPATPAAAEPETKPAVAAAAAEGGDGGAEEKKPADSGGEPPKPTEGSGEGGGGGGEASAAPAPEESKPPEGGGGGS